MAQTDMGDSAYSEAQDTRVVPQKDDRIIIIGAGVFGLSTARELVLRGYKTITVLDRYLPPVPDGSSVDVSRIIRPDYADSFYAKLGLEAMSGWQGEFKQFFHQSGLVCASSAGDHPYLETSRSILRRLGLHVEAFAGNEIRSRYPAIHGNMSKVKGYRNTTCGWANAEDAMRYLTGECSRLGVSFQVGANGTVSSLMTNGPYVRGVRTASGNEVLCDKLIVATGAWTPHLLNMDHVSVSNAQPVGFMQLSDEEAAEMRGCPVMIDLATGWFAFPPTPGTNILKMARHGYGFEIPRQARRENASPEVSVPSLTSNNAASTFLPDEAERALRDGLALFLPKFKDRPFIRRRLCWYTDTRNGDFIVDYHDELDNVFLATGGSGHAFKFLPIIGKYVADGFERKASTTQQQKWKWQPSEEPISKGDGSRGGPPRRALRPAEMARM